MLTNPHTHPSTQPTHTTHPNPPRRATTVYLVQRRIDMLPKPLTEDICSLRGGVERLAFSVIWEVTPQAEVSVRVRGGAGWVGVGCAGRVCNSLSRG